MRSILILWLFFATVSCEPGYMIAVRNTSAGEIYIRTRPAIELGYTSMDYFDSIVAIKISSNDSIATYRLRNGKEIVLWSYLGRPHMTDVPFDFFSVIVDGDTLQYSKETLLKKLTREKKGQYFLNFYPLD